ncbi:hypothetical protein GW755_02980 [bacterium]|nr:hypothetical protein [bacterium]
MPRFKKGLVKKFKLKLERRAFFYLIKKLFINRVTKILLVGFLAVFFLLTLIFYLLYPKVQKNINYGVNFSDKYATDLGMDWKDSYIEILDGLQVKNIRLVAYWDDIEKENNAYDFSNIRWQVEEAQKRDVNVILAMGRKVLRYPECHAPEWWNNMESGTDKDLELYQYLADFTNEMKGYSAIKTWQVENEPFFPFGECQKTSLEVLKKEVNVVREIDSRPILIQDSGEGGLWFPSYQAGDYLGISMYRRIWYNFWNILFGKFIYFKYPLSFWSYKIKAGLVGIPYEKVIVTELQAEPWGPLISSELSKEEKDKTMSEHLFIDTVNYAQKAGFKDLYFWGAEWWLFEKKVNNNPFFWDTARAVMAN